MIQLDSIYLDDYPPNWNISLRETTTFIIILVSQGQLLYELNDTTETLSQGDLLFIIPGVQRVGRSGSYPPHQKYSVHFQLEPTQAEAAIQAASDQGYILFKPRYYEYLRQRFVHLYQTWMTKDAYYEYACAGMAMELLASVLQQIAQQSIPYHKLEMAKKIEKYLFQHYKEEVKIETLAELIQRTPNYVSAIFKEVTGQTVIEYIHGLRIANARDLLLHSDMNIAEISDFLGFCDPSYFNRIFKKFMGQAPSILLKQRNGPRPSPR